MPKFDDFFIGFTANNPRPSTLDDFTVRYGGNGLYIIIYMRIDTQKLSRALFLAPRFIWIYI
jgi:hypothetical protein